MINLDNLIASGDAERLIVHLTDLARLQAIAGGETPAEDDSGWSIVDVCLECLNANKVVIGIATAEEAERVILNGYPRAHSLAPAATPEPQSAAFAKVVGRWLAARGWAVSDVRGDGNCFFRSIVRALFHVATPCKESISGLEEDSLSLYLRKEISTMGIYRDYIADDDGEQLAMERSGVWADAVQVAKVSQYLEAPVHVVRCDDPGLKFDSDNGCITPSPLYQYGNNFDEDPLILLYDPYPGHYHAIVKNVIDVGQSPEQLVKYLEESKTRCIVDDFRWVMHICNLYFVLEGVFFALRERPSDESTTGLCKMLLRSLRMFKDMIMTQCASIEKLYSLSAERPLLSIPIRLFSELYFDSITFAPAADEPLQRGSGPISMMYAEIQSIAAINPLLLNPQPKKDENENGGSKKNFGNREIPPQPQSLSELVSTRRAKGDANKLISMEDVSFGDWVSAISSKGEPLKFKCASVNYRAVDVLLDVIESGKVGGVADLIFDRCLLGVDGVKTIVARCRKGCLPCTVLMKECIINKNAEKILSESVQGLVVEEATYDLNV